MRYPVTKRVGLLTAMLALAAGAAFAYANGASYTGQGLIADGFGGYDLQTEICGVANGAEVDGPYLLWVLTATGASAADITGPWGTAAMTKFGNGTFKYVSGWYAPATLPGAVSGTYNGKAKNAQLVVSHGCRPFTHGAWCSPGFWRNATNAAWALVGHDRNLDLFDGFVSTSWYGQDLVPDVSLQTVLDNPRIYSGPANQGTGVACALNAFNATGAALTNGIPGYVFDCAAMELNNESDTCPIDHFGNFK